MLLSDRLQVEVEYVPRVRSDSAVGDASVWVLPRGVCEAAGLPVSVRTRRAR